MPGLCFQWGEPHTEKTLIDIEDSGDNNRDREVFLDKRVVEVERLLDEPAIVVPVVPDIELAIEWVPLLRMLCGLSLFLSPTSCSLFSRSPKNYEPSSISRSETSTGFGTHVNDIFGILHHLDFGPVICPSLIPEQFCNLAAEIEHLGKEGNIDIEPRFIGLESPSPNVWVLGGIAGREDI